MKSTFKLILCLVFVSVCSFTSCWSQVECYKPDETISIKMRDGKCLKTDLYYPSDTSNKSPCILIRSPAGRKADPWIKLTALRHIGYIVAMQDTRSASDKEGKTLPFLADGWGNVQDGYDTVEYLAKHRLCNGKVGTAGFSAAGITQLMMAPSAPPSLIAQHIGVAASSMYHHAIYPNGSLLKNQVEGWLGTYARHPSVLEMVCTKQADHAFWDQCNSLKVAHKVNVPGLIYGGWFDTFIQGTLDAFMARQERGGVKARQQQKLLIGPWTHFWPDKMHLGDFVVPEEGRSPPWDMTPAAWFDYHLKGVENHFKDLPPVTYYVMGPFDGTPSSGNKWKSASKWPVDSEKTALYVGTQNKLNFSLASEAPGHYPLKFDFENLVPTIGGSNLLIPSGPRDQRPIESRSDVIVFTSDELSEDLEVTGQLFSTIYYQSTDGPTPIAVRLTDVYPDGRSILLLDGMSEGSKVSQDSGSKSAIYKSTIDLWSTSFVFAKGHRIRLILSTSNYPRYEKKRYPDIVQEGSSERSVEILFGSKTPSHILLPIVKETYKEVSDASDHTSSRQGIPVRDAALSKGVDTAR